MKILQINSVYPHGSTGNIVRNLKLTMENNGIDAIVAHGIDSGKDDGKTLKFQNNLSVKLNILMSRIMGTHGMCGSIGTRKLIRWIDSQKPDIIHIHNIHGFYINVKMLFNYIKKKNIPLVWTMHDCWALTGHCAHFISIGCDKWKTGCGSCPGMKKYPIAYRDNSKKNYNVKKSLFTGVPKMQIVAPSEWLAGLVKQSYLGDYDIEVINNGIDLSEFYYRESDIKKKFGIEGKFVILGMANKWMNPKNADVIKKISEHIGDRGVILIVGEASEVKKVGNFIYIPRINNTEELSRYYSCADVFINLTLEDTFPTVNIESLACGTPIITYNSGGSPEIVDDETGYVCDCFDYEKINSCVDEIMKNGRQSYSNACIERAVEKYDRQEKFYEYINLYNKMV